jgi:hypothetical protein
MHVEGRSQFTLIQTWIMYQVSLLFENSIVQYLACKGWINFQFVTGSDDRNTKSCVMYMYMYTMSKTCTFDNYKIFIKIVQIFIRKYPL